MREEVEKIFDQSFQHSHDLQRESAVLTGSYSELFKEILLESVEKLQKLDVSLPIGLLKPKADMGLSVLEIYQGLTPEFRMKVDLIRDEKEQKLKDLVDRLVEMMKDHEVKGLCAPEKYYQQEHKRTCSLACFRMIFTDLTNLIISEDDFLDLARKYGFVEEGQIPGESVSDQVLFNLLTSQVFTEKFDLAVRKIDFMGVDLDRIQTMIEKFKLKIPSAGVYCVVSLASEVVDGGWYSCILLNADGKNVSIHDPSVDYGSASRVISKKDFINRWARTFLSGTLIIAVDTETSIT